MVTIGDTGAMGTEVANGSSANEKGKRRRSRRNESEGAGSESRKRVRGINASQSSGAWIHYQILTINLQDA